MCACVHACMRFCASKVLYVHELCLSLLLCTSCNMKSKQVYFDRLAHTYVSTRTYIHACIHTYSVSACDSCSSPPCVWQVLRVHRPACVWLPALHPPVRAAGGGAHGTGRVPEETPSPSSPRQRRLAVQPVCYCANTPLVPSSVAFFAYSRSYRIIVNLCMPTFMYV